MDQGLTNQLGRGRELLISIVHYSLLVIAGQPSQFRQCNPTHTLLGFRTRIHQLSDEGGNMIWYPFVTPVSYIPPIYAGVTRTNRPTGRLVTEINVSLPSPITAVSR